MSIYYVEGEIYAKLKEEYVEFLMFGAEHFLKGLDIFFQKEKILIQGIWNRRQYLEDFLKFIELYADEKTGNVRLFLQQKHDEDISFSFQKGVLFQTHFLDFSYKKRMSFYEVIETLEEKELEYIHIFPFPNNQHQEIYEKLQKEANQLLLTREKKDIVLILENIQKLSKKVHTHLCFYFSNEKICWNTLYQDYFDSVIVLSKKEPVTNEVIGNRFFTLGKYNLLEKRTIQIDNQTFPLSEPMMYFSYLYHKQERNLLYPDNTSASPCYECMYRIRNLSDGCSPCTPRIIR